MKPSEQKLGISKENTYAFLKKLFSSNIFFNKSCLKLSEIFFQFKNEKLHEKECCGLLYKFSNGHNILYQLANCNFSEHLPFLLAKITADLDSK